MTENGSQRMPEGKVVSMRELHENTAALIEHMNETGEPFVVTRHGRPEALFQPLDDHTVVNAMFSNLEGVSGVDELVELHSTEEVQRMLLERSAASSPSGITLDEAEALLDGPKAQTDSPSPNEA